jgi:GNAT superfamily N-acetyltransferase
MRVLRLDPADDGTISALYAARQAASRVDAYEPPVSEAAFRPTLLSTWSGAPAEVWYAPEGPDDAVAAWYRLEFPDLGNRERASMQLKVAPALRRHGLGTTLLRHAAERAAADGRVALTGMVRDGTPGEAFARQAGATFGQTDTRRVQDLTKVSAERIKRLNVSAGAAAAGYSLTRWEGPTPDDRLDQVAALQNALSDRPLDPGEVPVVWDARLVRERLDAWDARSGLRSYTAAAVHDATGELAALNLVTVDPGVPEWGHVNVTMVTRKHRGHRLGMLVKSAMVQWLAHVEPRVKRIDTWNSASNQHMVAINENLGYEVWGPAARFATIPATSILAA